MGRFRVRSPENDKWIDICQSEFYIRDPTGTKWIRLLPGKLAIRHGSMAYWVNIDCISENECDNDPFGGTQDGKGENGSGPGLPLDPETGEPMDPADIPPDGPDNPDSGGTYFGTPGGDTTNPDYGNDNGNNNGGSDGSDGGSDGRSGSGTTGESGSGTNTSGTNGSSGSPSGSTNPRGGGNDGNNSRKSTDRSRDKGRNRGNNNNNNWGNPDAGSSDNGAGDTNCAGGSFVPGEPYPPGYDLPDACGETSGERTDDQGNTCIVRESLSTDDDGNIIPSSTTDKQTVLDAIDDELPSLNTSIKNQIESIMDSMIASAGNADLDTFDIAQEVYDNLNATTSTISSVIEVIENITLSALCEDNQTGIQESTCTGEGTYDDPKPCPCTIYGIPDTSIIEYYIKMEGTVSGYVNFDYGVNEGRISVDVYHYGMRQATTDGKVSEDGRISFYYETGTANGDDIVFVRVRQDEDSDWQLSWGCPTQDPEDDYGTPEDPAPCHGTFVPTHGGGSGVHEFVHDFGTTSGQVIIEYQMWNIADRMDIYYRGQKIASTDDFVSGEGALTFFYNPVAGDTNVTIRVTSISDETSWVYLVNCPGEKGSSIDPKPCGSDIDSAANVDPDELENLVRSGGAGTTDTWYRMNDTQGIATIRYQMYNIMDTLEVFQNGNVIATTGGPVAGEAYLDFPFDPSLGTDILIRVTGEGKTSWSYLVICSYDPPSLTINDINKVEGDINQIYTFKVELSPKQPVERDITFDYQSVDLDTTEGVDYIPVSGTATIPAGDTEFDIDVVVYGDTEEEADERFKIVLSNAVNATISKSEGIGIIDNDDIDYVPPQLAITDASVGEGNGNIVFSGGVNPIAVFTVSFLDGTPRDRNVAVNYGTVGITATSGNDYIGSWGTLTIPAGQTSANIGITIQGDTDIEPDETFRVELSNPVNATIADGQGIGTIVNDDVFNPPVLVITDGSITEGDSGTKQLPFVISFQDGQPRSETVSVRVSTQHGTASGGTDFDGISNLLVTFNPGQTSQIVNVNIYGDTDAEIDEEFTLEMSNPVNAVLASDYSGTGTITNDDAPVTPCNQTSSAGGAGTTINTHYIGRGSGVVTIDCNAYSVEDAFEAIYDGSTVATTGGPISGTVTLSFFHDYFASGKDTFEMKVVGPNNTAWEYTVNCP